VHGNAERNERGEVSRQVLGRHAEMGCQYEFAVGKHEVAFSSSILAGAQYPFCKALDGRSQSVILEIFNDIAKLARKSGSVTIRS
jgi:hypothetical protein